ncbi:TPA: restriction endonuclease subunit S [Streptococcus suis]|nr:restriction endonuclease subunit S [Streptococcus suis]HEM6356408.1 restriction endonuclease subunit S [Streptococcus suis]HEM6380542.1 restriction endonuclease subunit S [Streptococcus suis]HEM6409762.1 restriction endonuclease subunit S [Streptococcus suis]
MVNYPKDWRLVEIEDIFTVTRGQVLSTEKIKDSKSSTYRYPVYSSQTLNNGLLGYYNDYLFKDAITWTTDGANAGDTNYRKGNFYCTNVCGVLLNNEGYANECIAAIINSISIKYVSYVGNPKLMNNVVKKIKICIPEPKEQQAIAETLITFDKHIENLSKLIEKKKMIRDGAVEDLVSGKKRLSNFSGKWDYKPVKSITKDVITGGTPSTNIKEYWGGSVPWLASTEIHQKNIRNATKNISDLGLLNSSAKIAPKDSVLIALAGQGKTRGTAAILGKDMAINQSLAALVCNEDNYYKFLFYAIEMNYEALRELSSGDGGRGGLNKKLIKEFKINISSDKNEQIAIANILSSMDKEIENLEKEKEKYQQLKSGAMDDLLTGKIRLV